MRRDRTGRAQMIVLRAEPSSGAHSPSGKTGVLPTPYGATFSRREKGCAFSIRDAGTPWRRYERDVSAASRASPATDDDAALAAAWSYARKRQIFLIAMAAPALIYVLAVAVGPMVQGFLYSFDSYNLIRPASRHFVGLDNYLALWRDPTARRAVINTFAFTFGAVTLEFVLGLGVALLLWRDDWFNRVALGLLLFPRPSRRSSSGSCSGRCSVRNTACSAIRSPNLASAVRAGCSPTLSALADLGRDRRLGMDAADGADPARRPEDAADRHSRGRRGRRRERAAAILAHGSADAAAGDLSRADAAHDGRLPGVRHHLRHHQRRPGGRHQRADDLRGQTGARILQHRRRVRDQHT